MHLKITIALLAVVIVITPAATIMAAQENTPVKRAGEDCSADEQHFIYLLNKARANPAASR